MKAENTTTDHNRTIRITEIPDVDGSGHLPELVITINYVTKPNEGGAIFKAVTLDGVVIPEIIRAINNCGRMDEFMAPMKKDYSRGGRLFDAAVEGLKEFYPELKGPNVVAQVKAAVTVPDTGNDQADYEKVRDQVEKQVQNLLIDRRTL